MQDLGRNKAVVAGTEHDIVLAEANSAVLLKGDFERMARRRFQRGQLVLRGKRSPVWVGRYREDIIRGGKIERLEKWVILGTKTDYPTRKLALRALEDLLADINNLSYRPRPVAQFSEFAKRWQEIVLSQHKPSTQPPVCSQLRKHLIPRLGNVAMKDISGELLQSCISDCGLCAKTVQNLVRWEIPRLCRGGSRSLTDTGVHRGDSQT